MIGERISRYFLQCSSDPPGLSVNTRQILAAMYQAEFIISLNPLPVCLGTSNTLRQGQKNKELVRVTQTFNLGSLALTRKMKPRHAEVNKNVITLTF